MTVCVCMEYMGKVEAVTLADTLHFMHFEIKPFAQNWRALFRKLFRTPTVLENEGSHIKMLELQAHTKKKTTEKKKKDTRYNQKCGDKI